MPANSCKLALVRVPMNKNKKIVVLTVCVIVFMHTQMLCGARLLLAILTNNSPVDRLSKTFPRLSTPPAETAVRHYFARGSLRLCGPLQSLVLGCLTSFSQFLSSFFSPNVIQSVHHSDGGTIHIIPSSL